MGTDVAFGRECVQAVLIGGLIAFRLIAEVPRSDAVHQQNRRGDRGPANDYGNASDRDDLRLGTKADEPRIIVRFQENPAFGKMPLEQRM